MQKKGEGNYTPTSLKVARCHLVPRVSIHFHDVAHRFRFLRDSLKRQILSGMLLFLIAFLLCRLDMVIHL